LVNRESCAEGKALMGAMATASADRMASPPGPARAPAPEDRLGPLDVLALSAGCGLAAGWLEVGARVLCRSLDATNRLSLMSRYFVWLVPLSKLLVFAGMGVLLAVVTKLWPRRGGAISSRILCAAALLPPLWVAGPRIHTAAGLILALGIAWLLVPRLKRPVPRLRRWLKVSFPGLLGLVLIVAGFILEADRLKQWHEALRPLPPAGSPNVLLIVRDTVRADHLSLYGYRRATSPTLERLAKRGLRFDEARATAPWTLPCHASLFTGRWPHELDVKWLTPLRGNFPTLAEYLGSRGYATADFVANTRYCSYDTGLDRGFTHYEDYSLDLERLGPLRMALLVDRPWDWVSKLALALSRSIDTERFRPRVEFALRWLLATGRKDAASINRAVLDWLSHRPEPQRPFFVFLNYFDAHSPYLPPEGTPFRFGLRPRTEADFILLAQLWTMIDQLRLAPRYRLLARDSYDNCLAYLDERLGELFDEFQRRGVLDRTWVIITSDHGEELGEHGLFDHGESLYRPEIRVPLLMVGPGPRRFPGVVRETVSLRDLPASVVDLVGLAAGSPFPGRSLAGLGRDPSPGADLGARDLPGAIAELSDPNPTRPSHGRSPASRGPLISLAERDYVYIRNERDGRELLFNERDDPDELSNRAGVEAMQPILQRLRQHLDQIRAGSPPPAR
jgi:arylsulfatase A-like enzyme